MLSTRVQFVSSQKLKSPVDEHRLGRYHPAQMGSKWSSECSLVWFCAGRNTPQELSQEKSRSTDETVPTSCESLQPKTRKSGCTFSSRGGEVLLCDGGSLDQVGNIAHECRCPLHDGFCLFDKCALV
ncbi:hypothetical protein Ae201684P_014941 [Aphanomyces euteiches]|uniref:Uncharacterized protein n=1 Tax=Aphanomyces euteiches TaxID=100861 RepID=A0A6G0XHF1_9STRA|nr:hypothetical protein Ae201684_004798 [Aphanomyces euteiches]KAH9073124.1 hypothetical protein Ae201684P_014941 [Aphanomyces euteiches]